jgi:hypothetical protein
MKSTTTELFWAKNHLTEFQQAWDDGDSLVSGWLIKIYQQGIRLDGRTELAIDRDVNHLIDVAREGCNYSLGLEYFKLIEKNMYRKNDACDYLSNAWDFISAAQCSLARRWGVYIEWDFSESM